VLDAAEKKEVTVAEETPLFRSTDIRSKEGMDLVRVFLSSAAAEGPLKAKFADLVKLQQEIGNVEQRIATVRDQMAEYRGRLDELHAQIVTLRAVKTAGPLMQDLEKKMQEMGDRVSKSTIELVGLQERLMVTRIKFQDGVAELTLERKEKEGLR
jgi:predicted  nucleic acid-binding Zn-ribbon protein